MARVENITISEAVRRAITEHVAAKRSDREFQERLDRFMRETWRKFDEKDLEDGRARAASS